MIKDLIFTKKASLLCFLFAFLFSLVQAQNVEKITFKQTGTASFYNKKFHGNKTSSGERLDNSRYTAAHPSIPFGTLVRVTNQKNGKSVVVKINDRFSPRKGHILDLTYSAAQEIDMVRQGIARVKVEVLDITEAEAEAMAIIPPDTITFKMGAKPLPLPVVKPIYEQSANLRYEADL